MNNEKLVLGAAVLFAAVLIAKKTGMLAKLTAGAAPKRFSAAGFAPYESPFESTVLGYDPSNPGAYVSVDDLIAGAAKGGGDWMTIPLFEQAGDNALRGFLDGGLVNKPTWVP